MTGPVESAVRRSIPAGTNLKTPAREAPFTVDKLDRDGVVLLLGAGQWATRLSWECLEGIPAYVRSRGSVAIGSRYEVEGTRGTLDEYLKRYVRRATAGWVAALLERAGVLEVARTRPTSVKVSGMFSG